MTKMSHSETKAWETYFKKKVKTNYPQWPNEVMLKLVFGNYLKNKIKINSRSKILDVSCGFGNNLLPFLLKGCDCYGTEVTKPIATQTQKILNDKGFKTDIRMGKNTSIPFEDNFFDLLLSINVIHYESTYKNVQAALVEYNRVLKKGGRVVLLTVGPAHTIIKQAKHLRPHCYEIQNFDFRTGTQFFCFDHLEYLKKSMSRVFSRVEAGRVIEKLMTVDLDFLIAVAQSEK